jgi:drug/metabolite transporter (DMT)-like permease
MTAATWAGYSVLITPLMRRYSPFRISSLVLLFGWIPIAITGSQQTFAQSFHFSALVWACFAFAVVGPLFLTNILWFTAISRVGPSRASLFSNMQPIFGVLFALVLLGEHLSAWEVVGGVAIVVAVLLERSRHVLPEPPGD